MTDEEFQAKWDRIKGLRQYKDKTPEQLRKKWEEEESVVEDELDVGSMFEDKDEKKYARVTGAKYLATFALETIAEKNALKQLVYLETFQLRLQKILNDFEKEGKAPPPNLIDSMHKNVHEITALKNQLRLHKAKEEESGAAVLSLLKRKFEKWREENQGSRTLVCPHCGKMVMLKIRTEAWEAQKHPFFKDRFIANKHLFKLYKDGTITKEDVASVLETSPDYVDTIIAKLPSDYIPSHTKKIDTNQLDFNFPVN